MLQPTHSSLFALCAVARHRARLTCCARHLGLVRDAPMLQRLVMQACSKDEAIIMLQQRTLGVVRLRHLPRHAGMRPLSNLSCPTQVPASSRARGMPSSHEASYPHARQSANSAASHCERPFNSVPGTGKALRLTTPAAEHPAQPARRRHTRAQRPQATPSGSCMVFKAINKVLEPVHAALKCEAAQQVLAHSCISGLCTEEFEARAFSSQWSSLRRSVQCWILLQCVQQLCRSQVPWALDAMHAVSKEHPGAC